MEILTEKIKKILEFLGYHNSEISFDAANNRISILVSEPAGLQKELPQILPSLERVVNLMIKKSGGSAAVVDINNYRRERERLIVELAKAAAHKVSINKAAVELPPMNAYERRLVHVEISTRPDLKTESIGDGPERRVIVKLIEI